MVLGRCGDENKLCFGDSKKQPAKALTKTRGKVGGVHGIAGARGAPARRM